MPKLYVIASPIGNLKDITLRALEILREVDVVLAEDTRVTRKLLAHYGISKQVLRYVHGKKYNFETAAFVSDAGTPAISDPSPIKLLNDSAIELIAIPGPSALTAMISISDIELSDFIFLGFPPAKKGRQKFFKQKIRQLADEYELPIILYESPHRIIKTLKAILDSCGDRYINIGRELTKMHEEVFRGKVSEAILYITGERERGEFVIVIK